MQEPNLPPSDYLIIEEIVSRRAKVAEQEKAEQKRIQAALEDAEHERELAAKGRGHRVDKNRIVAKGRLIEQLRRGRQRGQALALATEEKIVGPKPWTGQPLRLGKAGREGMWTHVRSHLILASVEHDRVQAQIDEFRRHPGRVTYLTRKAEPFLNHIVSEIGRKGLPLDLVIVPMVESGFEPTAVSPKAAAGLWQIIPSTGVENGLTVTEEYDGRYDVHASTQAALRYFKHLIGLFKGDWLLALAAYNCGEGAIQRAVAANAKAGKGTSFWDLNLPAETQAYVPKIVALARMISDPATLGQPAKKQVVTAELASVEFASQTGLNDVVTASGLTPEDFFRLNPAFKPDVAPPGKTYNIMLPVDKAQVVAAKVPGAKFLGTKTIVVKKGDTLDRLAKRHGVPKVKLAEWNGLTPDTPLTPGQELLVFPV
jgi:membrane-bound lytic murein transglycosylase D